MDDNCVAMLCDPDGLPVGQAIRLARVVSRCEPNLAARIVRGHILYLAIREIKAGEELTVDYHFDADVEKVPCACGSLKCRGTINIKE